MGNRNQFEVPDQRLLTQGRTQGPDWYRDTDTLDSPSVSAQDSRDLQSGFASTILAAASPHRDQQKRAAYPNSPFQQAIHNPPAAQAKEGPSWYQNTIPPIAASEAANTALAAITDAATTVGNTLAWWGTYLTDIVADVTGDNELSEEQLQKQEQQRLADKEASKHNHGSVSGDVAQPLTRRHSRSSSGSLMRHASGSFTTRSAAGLVRGTSTFLDENWQGIPKSPGPNLPQSPAPTGTNGSTVALGAANSDEDEYMKKDT